MSESKYVVFNNSRGPITVTLYTRADKEELSKYSSHRRRREARKVFKIVVIPANASKDLVAETGFAICEFENNPELQSIIQGNKLRVVLNTDAPVVIEEPKPVQEIKPEVLEVVPPEPEFIISDILEEVVDEEELRRTIMEEAMEEDKREHEEDRGLTEDGKEVKVEVKKEKKKEEKPSPKKRGRKPNKK